MFQVPLHLIFTYIYSVQIKGEVSAIPPIYVCSGRRHFSNRRNSAFADDYALNFGGYQSAVDGDLDSKKKTRVFHSKIIFRATNIEKKTK